MGSKIDFAISNRLPKGIWIITTISLFLIMQIGCNKSKGISTLGSYVSNPYVKRTNLDLNTCFEDQEFELDKKNVESAVSSALKTAGFTSSGWLNCDGSNDVIVSFDPNSRISKTTRVVDSAAKEVFRVSIGLKSLCKPGVDFSGSQCEASYAIHEFGHVIGLRHEMNRRDNYDCDQDQMNGQGEASALQIGDFDEYSIMNYCSLAAAVLENKYLGFSSGDLEAIDALYRFPIAMPADSLPRSIQAEKLKITIQGSGVTQYRFQIGEIDKTNCKDESNYSNSVAADVALDYNMLTAAELNFKIPFGKTLKLCLLGGLHSENGDVWQPVEVYSSTNFSFIDPNDTAPPVLKRAELSFDPSDEKFVIVKFAVNDISEIADTTITFSFLDIPYKPKPQAYRFKHGLGDVTEIYTRVPISDLVAKGKVTIEHLTITDRNGNAADMVADKTNMLLAPNVALPFLTIESGKAYESDAPMVSNVYFTLPSVKKGSLQKLDFLVDEASGISSINLFLINPVTRKIKFFSATQENIITLGNGIVDAYFDFSILPESGIYRIQSVTMYDLFGNKAILKSSSVKQEYFDSTSITVPSFEYLSN